MRKFLCLLCLLVLGGCAELDFLQKHQRARIIHPPSRLRLRQQDKTRLVKPMPRYNNGAILGTKIN